MTAPPDRRAESAPRPSSDGLRERPLLASEALRDDLAPLAPLAMTARMTCALLATAAFVVASLPALGAGLVSSATRLLAAGWAVGATALLVAFVPLPYAARAAVMLVLGLCVGVAGALGLGPAFALEHVSGPWAPAHLAALVPLPAALLFRARYRAYSPARWLLVVGLLLALPHAVIDVQRIVEAWELAVRVAHGLALGAVLLSLLGFMGSETTGAGDTMAWSVVGTITAAIGSEIVWAPDRLTRDGLPLGLLLSALIVGLSAAAAALGGFGLLAAGLGPRAREQAPQSSRARRERAPRASVGGWLSRF